MIVSQGQRSLPLDSINNDMSLLPHISKGLVGELLTRPTNLSMNPMAKLLSPSKCDYVVSKGLWANLSCCRHPPGKQPKPCWHKAVPNREIVSSNVSCALYHRPTCPEGMPVQLAPVLFGTYGTYFSFQAFYNLMLCFFHTHSPPCPCLHTSWAKQYLYSLQYPSQSLCAYLIIASSFDSRI